MTREGLPILTILFSRLSSLKRNEKKLSKIVDVYSYDKTNFDYEIEFFLCKV